MTEGYEKKLTFDEYYKGYFLSQKYFFDFATKGAFLDVAELRNGSRKYCFEFKKQTNLPCPCCGKIMTTREELLSFIENTKTKRGEELVCELEKYKNRLRGVELKVVKKLITLAPKHRDKNLKELFLLMYRNSIKQLEKSQQKVIAKVNKLSDGLEGETYKAVKKDIVFTNCWAKNKTKETKKFLKSLQQKQRSSPHQVTALMRLSLNITAEVRTKLRKGFWMHLLQVRNIFNPARTEE